MVNYVCGMKPNVLELKKWLFCLFVLLLSAPGGTLSDDVTCTEFCLFKAQEDMETMQAYAQVKNG